MDDQNPDMDDQNSDMDGQNPDDNTHLIEPLIDTSRDSINKTH